MRSLVLLLLTASVALGADPPVIPPTVWMGPVLSTKTQGASLIARRFEETARREVRKLKTTRLVGPRERVVQIKAGDLDPRVERAENHRTTGQALYDAGKLDAAKKDLDAALQLYEHAIVSVKRIDAVARTLGYLGAVHWKQDQKKVAKAFFWRAALLATDEEVAEMPAVARPHVEALRNKAARRPRGRLSVKSVPKGAEVLVDGESRGNAPLTVKGLARGPHYVQIRHADAGWAGAVVELKGRRPRKKLSLVASQELGQRKAEAVPPKAVISMLEGFVNKPPQTHSRRAKKRKLKARRKALARALDQTRALTHADFAVLTLVESDGKRGFVARIWVHQLASDRRLELEPLPLGSDVANVFVPAIAYAKSVAAKVELMRTTPPEKKKKKKRRRRRRRRR